MVLGLFIDKYALEEMRETGDGSTICALLHTCSYTRYRAAMGFEPIRIRQEFASSPYEHPVLAADPRLMQYAHDAVSAWFDDWSIERYESRSPNVKECSDYLRTEGDLRGKVTECTAWIFLDTLPLGPLRREGTQDWCATTTCVSEKEDRFATVEDGCSALQEALRDCWESRLDPQEEWNFPTASLVRFANPYHRALTGSLGTPVAGATVRVEYWLYHLELFEDEDELMGNASWLFHTIKAGEEEETA